MKKLIALILAVIMMFALCACGDDGGSNNAADLEPLTKDDVVSMTIISGAGNPFREDWKVWEYIQEGTGATLDIHAIPVDYLTKVALMYAGKDSLTDIVCYDYKPDTDKYAIQRAMMPFEDYEEYMPNYNNWKDSLPEEEYDLLINNRRSFDGKIYASPATGMEQVSGVRAWIYRKDIFDKHGLNVPTTYDEVYEVSKKLKELYPNSYPFALRQGFANMRIAGSNWKEYWEPHSYYDFNADKWVYGASEDVMLDIIKWYKKMIDEKLLPADFMTIDSSTWEELFATERAFISIEYLSKIDSLNPVGRKTNPEYTLTAFVPPVANTETGKPALSKQNHVRLNFTISNTGDARRMANAAKFIDWFYSDEAVELVSWGKEGETFETVNGKKQYILDEKNSLASHLYGFTTYGTFTRLDPDAAIIQQSEEVVSSLDMVMDHTNGKMNPAEWIAFTEEEQKIVDETFAACKTYTEGTVAKFILGQEPLSKFDEFRQGLVEVGSERLLGAYESAYNRVKQ